MDFLAANIPSPKVVESTLDKSPGLTNSLSGMFTNPVNPAVSASQGEVQEDIHRQISTTLDSREHLTPIALFPLSDYDSRAISLLKANQVDRTIPSTRGSILLYHTSGEETSWDTYKDNHKGSSVTPLFGSRVLYLSDSPTEGSGSGSGLHEAPTVTTSSTFSFNLENVEKETGSVGVEMATEKCNPDGTQSKMTEVEESELSGEEPAKIGGVETVIGGIIYSENRSGTEDVSGSGEHGEADVKENPKGCNDDKEGFKAAGENEHDDGNEYRNGESKRNSSLQFLVFDSSEEHDIGGNEEADNSLDSLVSKITNNGSLESGEYVGEDSHEERGTGSDAAAAGDLLEEFSSVDGLLFAAERRPVLGHLLPLLRLTDANKAAEEQIEGKLYNIRIPLLLLCTTS